MSSNSASLLRLSALAAALGLAFSTCASAQTAVAPSSAASAAAPASAATPTPATTLAPVVVTANPLGREEIAAPVSVLAGDELVVRRGSTLGDTLNGLPNVASSYFGPNAGRPIVRGLDGERVKVMGNGGASLDASTLSFDHAVPIDPLIVDRVEVLRGPGALLYGGSAVGGVVNTLDNRIPREAQDGTSGAAEFRLGGAESERGGAALVETGDGRLTLHADVFSRRTDDLRVPTYTPLADGTPLTPTRRVRNSAGESEGGAVGASLFFDRGYIGVSADTYDSSYGAVVEEDVKIKMKRDHFGLASELKDPSGPIRKLRTQINHTRYQHQELEGAEIGTTFKTSGDELRIEAEHAPLGKVHGSFGFQWEDSDFSALGEEAFVSSTRTRRAALFLLEELPWRGGTLSAGARVEQARIASDGDTDASVPRFGEATERRFTTRSASLSNLYKLSPQWSLSGGLSYTERAPTSFELFANGVHAATGAYELGNADLKTERGVNLDAAATWTSGHDRLRIGAFSTHFSRFLSLDATGNDIAITENGVTETYSEYVFRPVRARLNGVEIEARHRMATRPGWHLDGTGQLDLTRGTNLDSDEPLPRIAPLRLRLGLNAGAGLWNGRAELDHSARQNRVPATDVPTASFSVINLSLTRRFSLGEHSDALWFLKINNLGDALGYNAASVQTVRGLSPLPGRSIKTGIRVSF